MSKGEDSDDDIGEGTKFEEDDGVCFVRLWRTSETAGNGNLARSADIGVPIGSGSGEVPLNDDGEPLFPEIPAIDDGEWHTLRLAVEGELVRAWLDDRLIAAATDDTYESGGAAIMVRTAEVDLDDYGEFDALDDIIMGM